MAKRNKSSRGSGRPKPMSGTAGINRRYDEGGKVKKKNG